MKRSRVVLTNEERETEESPHARAAPPSRAALVLANARPPRRARSRGACARSRGTCAVVLSNTRSRDFCALVLSNTRSRGACARLFPELFNVWLLGVALYLSHRLVTLPDAQVRDRDEEIASHISQEIKQVRDDITTNKCLRKYRSSGCEREMAKLHRSRHWETRCGARREHDKHS